MNAEIANAASFTTPTLIPAAAADRSLAHGQHRRAQCRIPQPGHARHHQQEEDQTHDPERGARISFSRTDFQIIPNSDGCSIGAPCMPPLNEGFRNQNASRNTASAMVARHERRTANP